MTSRFDQYLNTLKQRKEQLELKIKLPTPPNQSFFKDYVYQEPKLNKLGALIQHIQDYENKTMQLVNENFPENSIFYNEHMDMVENLLASIEEKYTNSEKFSENDFKLIFTPSKTYEITSKDKNNTISDNIREGMQLGVGIAIVMGLLAGAAAGITCIVFFGAPGIFLTISALFAGAMIGYVAGALLGSLVGLGVGVLVASDTMPTNNKYINNTVFDCSLLQAAYQETMQIAGNDERVERRAVVSLD